MKHKLYSIENKKSFNFSEFKIFQVSQIDQDEFAIIEGKKQQSVRICEVFVFSEKKYFVFNSEKINMLIFKSEEKHWNENLFSHILKLFKRTPKNIYFMIILLFFCITLLNQKNTLSQEKINWNSTHIKQDVIQDFFQKKFEEFA